VIVDEFLEKPQRGGSFIQGVFDSLLIPLVRRECDHREEGEHRHHEIGVVDPRKDTHACPGYGVRGMHRRVGKGDRKVWWSFMGEFNLSLYAEKDYPGHVKLAPEQRGST
jgi:hypothetical protein